MVIKHLSVYSCGCALFLTTLIIIIIIIIIIFSLDFENFEWEIQYNHLDIIEPPLGRGPHGVVHKAMYRGQEVAVKISTAPPSLFLLFVLLKVLCMS
jgi:hypothetical protein